MELKAFRTKHGWRYRVTDDNRKIKIFGNIAKYKRDAKEEALKAYEDEIRPTK